MRRAFVAAMCFLGSMTAAVARDQGFTADLGGTNQEGVPNDAYTLLLFRHLTYNTFPEGSVVLNEGEFSFVAPRDGIVRFSGQIWSVLDNSKSGPEAETFAVKIFKNANVSCQDNDVFTGIGSAGPGSNWWRAAIPIQGEDLAAKGDVYQWCVFVTSGNGRTSAVDGNSRHTRIHVSMSGADTPQRHAQSDR